MCILFVLLLIVGITKGYANGSGVYTIALMDVEAIGLSQTEAKIISEYIRYEFAQIIKSKKYKASKNADNYILIERGQMDQILNQFDLYNIGCTSDSCAIEFGKILNAHRIGIGSCGKIGETYSLSYRIVDVETTETIAISTKNYTGDIEDVLNVLIKEVVFDLLAMKKNRIIPLPKIQISHPYTIQGHELSLYYFRPFSRDRKSTPKDYYDIQDYRLAKRGDGYGFRYTYNSVRKGIELGYSKRLNEYKIILSNAEQTTEIRKRPGIINLNMLLYFLEGSIVPYLTGGVNYIHFMNYDENEENEIKRNLYLSGLGFNYGCGMKILLTGNEILRLDFRIYPFKSKLTKKSNDIITHDYLFMELSIGFSVYGPMKKGQIVVR